MANKHEVSFSHEFEDGPSGPARSYWDITRNGGKVLTVRLHHRSVAQHVETDAERIAWALDHAFEEGRKDKAAEVRRVIGAVDAQGR